MATFFFIPVWTIPLRLVTAVVQSNQWADDVWKCVLRSVFLLFTLGLKSMQPHNGYRQNIQTFTMTSQSTRNACGWNAKNATNASPPIVNHPRKSISRCSSNHLTFHSRGFYFWGDSTSGQMPEAWQRPCPLGHWEGREVGRLDQRPVLVAVAVKVWSGRQLLDHLSAAAADAGPFSRPWFYAALEERHREVRPPTDTSSSAWLPPGPARWDHPRGQQRKRREKEGGERRTG